MSILKVAGEDRPEELAILVHGTFAGDPADSGQKWWQSGSRESEELQKVLPKHVRVATGKEVFHWSGENGERARSKAAAQLLEHLKPFEKSGRPYHLVGHSHGGSVIWNAIRTATQAGRPLQAMQSWTTVGTPFLYHSSRSPWHAVNLVGVFLGLALIQPAMRILWGISSQIYNAARGEEAVVMARSDQEVGYMAIVRAPFLYLAECLGVAVERSEEGIRLGSFDPSGDASMLGYLFASREGLVLMGIILLCSYMLLQLGVMCVRPIVESVRIHSESRLQQRAFHRYGPNWLGIWSPDDEAINGLRATIALTLSFVKKMAPCDRVFLTDNLSLISRPYYWLIAPVYNHLLRPSLDLIVRGVLTRSAQGNDRPTAQVVAVGAAPVAEASQAPALPEFLRFKLLHEADRHAAGIAPKLRQMLGCPSFSSGLEFIGVHLSGKELVHTSYFNQPEVLDLIALNIAWSGDDLIADPLATTETRSLRKWFKEFKHVVAENDPRLADSALEQLLRHGPREPLQRKAG